MYPVLLFTTLLLFPTYGSDGAAEEIYDDVQVKDDTVMLQVTQKVYRSQAVRPDQFRNTTSLTFNARETTSKSVIALRKSLSLSHVLSEVSNPTKEHVDYYAGVQRKIGTQDLVCSCFAIASIFLTIVVWYLWKNSTTQELKHNVGRTALLDNAKALAMFCVIFQHLYDFRYWGTELGLDFPNKIKYAMRILDMPLFSIISGLCSQQPPTAKRICGLITSIALPAVIHVSVVQPVLIDSIDHPSQLAKNILGFFKLETATNIFDLSIWPWYLVALLVWRGCSFIMHCVHLQSCILVTCVLISCIGGYLQTCKTLSQPHFITSTIGYWAYFAIGYTLPFDAIMKRVLTLSPSTRFAAAVGAILWVIGTVTPNIFHPLPEAHFSYCVWLARFDDDLTQMSQSHLFAWRLTKISLDSVACLLWLLFVIPRADFFLTQAGQYSLYAYLHHEIGAHVYVRLKVILYRWGWNKSQIVQSDLALVECAVMTLVTLLFVTSWPWRWLFSWAVEPTWANHLIKRLTPDSGNRL